MSDFDLDALEKAVVSTNVTERAELPPAYGPVDEAPATDAQAGSQSDESSSGEQGPDLADIAPQGPQFISEGIFVEQWALVHGIAGGLVQSRTGAPCDLAGQARSEGGLAAAQATYELISMNPALANMILSTESTFFGQLAIVGMHGFSCVQIVKASVTLGRETRDAPPQFRSTRVDMPDAA